MAKRKALSGAGAASIAVMATLAGAPAAAAQECVTCPGPQPGSNAFVKLAELQFPGTTLGVFGKEVGAGAPAFIKIGELGFPGATENVFIKTGSP